MVWRAACSGSSAQEKRKHRCYRWHVVPTAGHAISDGSSLVPISKECSTGYCDPIAAASVVDVSISSVGLTALREIRGPTPSQQPRQLRVTWLAFLRLVLVRRTRRQPPWTRALVRSTEIRCGRRRLSPPNTSSKPAAKRPGVNRRPPHNRTTLCHGPRERRPQNENPPQPVRFQRVFSAAWNRSVTSASRSRALRS